MCILKCWWILTEGDTWPPSCIVPELVRAVSLGERVGWGTSLVWPKSEAIDPALDNFPGKCAELERAVKLVNNSEGTGPPKS